MKTAIVLGASGGLGKAIVEMLLTEKFEIIGTYHLNKPRENLFDKTILTHLDISDKSSIDEFCDKIKDKKIDFFVNTIANSLNFKNFNKIEVEDYESDIRINLLNYIYLLKKIINQFNPKSNIVFILTKAVIGTSPRAFSSYVVSKYALLGFMKSLSVELKDIKVNAISPGMMDTKFVPDFLKKMSPNLVNPKDVAKEIKKIISGGNTGQNILV